MLKSIFFTAIVLLPFGLVAQTPAEKVAAGFCKCSEDNAEFTAAVTLLRSGDMKLIRERFEEVETQFFAMKKCAKSKVVLTKEEGRKVPEDEITAALNKNCPDAAFLGDEYRRISHMIHEEQRIADIAERHKKIQQHLAKKEADSVRIELADYKSWYGFSSDRGPELIGYYYQIGDFETGNMEAMELIDTIKNEYFIYDDRTDKTVSIYEFVKTGLLSQAKKYKQQKVIDALK